MDPVLSQSAVELAELAGEAPSSRHDAEQLIGEVRLDRGQPVGLPARRAAFSEWSATDPYIRFLQGELERAEAFPNAATSNIISALNTAVFDVISSAKSPQTAAEEAAAAISP